MFGMPTLLELNTVADHIALCKELGLSFVELNTNFPSQQLHIMDPSRLKELAREAGIFYTMHLNDDLFVADFNPSVSGGYCESVLSAIAFAKEADIRILNIHLAYGAKYTMPQKKVYFYEAYEAEYLQKITAFRDLCAQHIGSSPIRICVENTNGYLPFQKKALEILLDSPVFGLTFDIGHNRCAADADEAWILAHGNRLHHLHLHDVRGRQDHLPFGEGDLDLKPYLALAQDRTAVIEVKTIDGLRKSVSWLKSEFT